MATNLEVDAFEIDLEALYDATRGTWRGDLASRHLVEEVIKNLSIEDKKRFRKYQEQENPCKGGE